MGGKITDVQLLAIRAREKLKDIAATEGRSKVPSEKELAEYLKHLGPDEDPIKNQELEKPGLFTNLGSLLVGRRK